MLIELVNVKYFQIEFIQIIYFNTVLLSEQLKLHIEYINLKPKD